MFIIKHAQNTTLNFQTSPSTLSRNIKIKVAAIVGSKCQWKESTYILVTLQIINLQRINEANIPKFTNIKPQYSSNKTVWLHTIYIIKIKNELRYCPTAEDFDLHFGRVSRNIFIVKNNTIIAPA